MWLIWLVILAVGLAQIPLLVDCLRTLFPKWRIVRVAGRVNNVLLFLLLGCLAAVAYLYYFLMLYLPLAVNNPFTSLAGWAHIVFSAWIFINMVFNYLFSVFLSPGVSDRGTSPALPSEGEESIDHASPPTLKCRQCDCHVMYMDHHCPFTGNCVGLQNYRHFLLLLVYSIAGLLYALLLTGPTFRACHWPTLLWALRFTDRLDRGGPAVAQLCRSLRGHTFITVPVGVGVLALTSLLAWQLLMLCADTSTRAVLQPQPGRGVPFREVCSRIGQRRFRRPHSRWRLMLRDRTRWYQVLFPLPNQLSFNRLDLVSKHDNKKHAD